MCKITYEQLAYQGIYDYIDAERPLIIHLTRRNMLRQAISAAINVGVRKGVYPYRPQHTKRDFSDKRIELDGQDLLRIAGHLKRQKRAVGDWLQVRGRRDVLELTYEAMIGPVVEAKEVSPAATDKICNFLGIEPMTLPCRLRRINGAPLEDILLNFDEVSAIIKGTWLEQWWHRWQM